MEGADVKAGAEGGFGAVAELADFELPDLVSEGLTGPGDVAIHFVDDIEFGLGGVGEEVVDGLLASPFLVMDAGVDDEANAAPEVIDELTEVVIGVVVEPEFVAEPLGVESPAFDKACEIKVAAELGVIGLFLGEGDLEMMTRNRLMQGEGHHFPFGAHVGSVEVDGEGAGAAAVCGGAAVVSGAGVRGGFGGDGLDGEAGGGKSAEEFGKAGLNLGDEVFVA